MLLTKENNKNDSITGGHPNKFSGQKEKELKPVIIFRSSTTPRPPQVSATDNFGLRVEDTTPFTTGKLFILKMISLSSKIIFRVHHLFIYEFFYILDYSSSNNAPPWQSSDQGVFYPTESSSSNISRSFDYSNNENDDNNFPDLDSFDSTNFDETTNPNVATDDSTSSYEQLPFKVIHPSNFQETKYNNWYQIQKESLAANDAQNINNFKIINEPLMAEDFNVVDALMAEPIWSTIEHNVAGEELIGDVSDIIPDHEMDHLSLSVPESSSILNGYDSPAFNRIVTKPSQLPPALSNSPKEESGIIRNRVSR